MAEWLAWWPLTAKRFGSEVVSLSPGWGRGEAPILHESENASSVVMLGNLAILRTVYIIVIRLK